MSPLTPFLTETMYSNLRRCLPSDAPESVHFQDIPASLPEQTGDPQIVESVARMQSVIELGRVLREQKKCPLRTPLKCLTVAHADPYFVQDLTGVHSPRPSVAPLPLSSRQLFMRALLHVCWV